MKENIKTVGGKVGAMLRPEKLILVFAFVLTTLYLSLFANPMTAFAADGGGGGGSISGVVSGAGTVAGAIVAVIMIVMLVRHGMEYAQGQGNIGKMVIDVLVLLLMIGLIAVAMNWESLQSGFEGIANGGVDVVEDAANTIL